jgi:hypothetical protein
MFGKRKTSLIGDAIQGFLGQAEQSLQGHLNVSELLRVVVTALLTGAGTLGVLSAIQAAAGTVFPQPADAALAVSVLTAIADVVRRLGQGKTLPPGALR